MHGRTSFPRIGTQPYVLTLGPYACYWFELLPLPAEIAPLARPVPATDPTADLVASLPTVLVGADWEGVFDSATRDLIERQALVPFLRRQRWFSQGTRDVRKVRFSDWGRLRTGPTPAFLTMASVAFADGAAETFSVPLAFVAGAEADRVLAEQPAAVLARIKGARQGLIVDGLLDDQVCDRLLDLTDSGADLVTARGTVKGLAGRAGAAIDRTVPRRWPRRDHQNSVAWLHDQLMLKLYRRIEPGAHPEVEMLRALPAHGFRRSPSLEGAIGYERPGLEPGTLATIQAMVGHQGSGWDFTLDELRRYFEQVAARAHTGASSADAVRSLERYYLASAAMLGARTAEMHVALSRVKDFAPEPLDRDGLRQLGEQLTQSAAAVLERLHAASGSLAAPAKALTQEVIALEKRLMARLGAVGRVAGGGMRLRIHGDYHLGQVLRTEEDFVLLDFEGDPGLPLAERREKQSPIKDLAGMLRSFDHAVHAAVRSPAVDERWATLWLDEVQLAFVTAYRATLGPLGILPEGDDFDVLLRAFMIDAAFRELGHELARRPDRAGVPLAGLQQLA
jgi:maltose alpha-D-glucosyltransferase/alpha-amylase